MVRWLKKILLIIITLVLVIFLVYIFGLNGFHSLKFIGATYHNRRLSNVAGYQESAKYNICKYAMPEKYRLIRYMDALSENQKNIALVLLGETPGDESEYYLVLRLPLFHHIDFTTIYQNPKRVKKEYTAGTTTVYNDPVPSRQNMFYVNLNYYFPFFWTYKDNPKNRSLILRGMLLDDDASVEGDKVQARVFYGKFRELGFDKEKDRFLQRYIVKVLDFKKVRTGAVAIVKDKFSDATIFAIGVGPKDNFNKEKFEKFLKSIDFKAEVFDPDDFTKELGLKVKKFIK